MRSHVGEGQQQPYRPDSWPQYDTYPEHIDFRMTIEEVARAVGEVGTRCINREDAETLYCRLYGEQARAWMPTQEELALAATQVWAEVDQR